MREDGFAGVAELAAIGTLVADRTRCQILLALLDGQKLSASNLAAVAGVSAATASSHLSKLARAGLLRVEPEGRHRIYRIARPEVADLIRALEFFADPVRAARGS